MPSFVELPSSSTTGTESPEDLATVPTEAVHGPGFVEEKDVESPVANLPLGSPAPSHPTTSTNETVPAASEDTIVSCGGDATLVRAETIVFTYALETSTNGLAAVEFVRKEMERALARDIANLLLPCDVDIVQADNALGFEAVDHVPEDSFSEEGDCDAVVDTRHACTVFDGILTVYISPEADFELARYYTLTAIRETISLLDAQINDLERAAYLGPEIVNPIAFGDSEEAPQNIAPGPNNINASLVLFAVGGCAFAASVGLVYYLRRHGTSSSSFGAATHAAGFDQDGNMSAILELDDESATQRSGVVSESGYTTDEDGSTAISMDGTASLNRLNSPMLGARKRYDTSMDSLLELM
ncbi:expressed unknown protein [Seminavis robusta]|uniref:Uncharacterized protein n=1 Tax=Seminavis robusta TaxID=568900 RepID=A0A9N8DRL2_9STRA|nr:expressed unknown protein [Seminavis robusta]|eukprot:Sro305_g112840.1 n/a (357) ;mRNA; r:63433-64827